MASTQASDVPAETGQLSPALKERLAQEDLQDLEILFRYRGVRTLRSLLSLESNDRAVLLTKARDIYEILGFFPSNLKTALEKIFGNGEASCLHGASNQGASQSPLQPGSIGSASTAYHATPWTVGSSSSNSSWNAVGPHPTGSVGPGPVTPMAELAEPASDDSHLKKDLKIHLEAARETMGRDRYAEVCRRLRRSDDLVTAGCLEAAEALAALAMRKEDLRDRQKKELLKAAKKVVRDVLLWRCCGNALGLDSREALVRAFEEACRYTNCDENTVSQLTNGYRRIKEELQGGMPTKKTTRQESEVRSPRAGLDTEVSSGPCAATGGIVPVGPQLIAQDSALPAVAAQAMNQRVVTDVLAPGAPIHRPASCVDWTPKDDCQPEPVPEEVSSGPTLSRASLLTGQWKLSGDGADDTLKVPAVTDFVMPKADGDLLRIVVRTLQQELEMRSPDFCEACASWLAEVAACSEDAAIVSMVKDSLTKALRREGVEERSLRPVMKALVHIAGLETPLIPNLLQGGPEMARLENQPEQAKGQDAIVPVLAEIWSGYLAESMDSIVACETSEQTLIGLVDLTKSFVKRCEKKVQTEVARDCCRALRILACLTKDNVQLRRDTAEWISERVIQYSGYPGVMHEGFIGLVEICKAQHQLFGLDLSPTLVVQEEKEILAQHLKDGVMGLVRTCEAKKPSKDTMWKAVALLAHTHPFVEVMRHISVSKDLAAGKLLSRLLDEIALSLRPALSEWQQATSHKSHLRMSEGRLEPSQWALTALKKVQRRGGVGVEALKTLAPGAAAGDLTQASPSLQLLVQWATAVEQQEVQERFFLIGVLFDVRALLPILVQVAPDEQLFVAACAALCDLNSLSPLDKPSRKDIANWTRILQTPSSLQSCAAWASVVGMAFPGWAASEVPDEQTVAEEVGQKVLDALDTHKRRPGRAGWTEFLHEALRASNCLLECSDQTKEKLDTALASQLKELALEWKVGLEKEACVLKQAELLLEKV